jgi:hypothetical protein
MEGPDMLSRYIQSAMEMLHLVPKTVGFEEAMLVMENLATLRPAVVQSLLEACRSVKVKRLFLYMAERHGHPWASQLDHSRLNLGRGKRVIVPGGKLDKRYLVTVPRQSLEERAIARASAVRPDQPDEAQEFAPADVGAELV